MSGTKRVVVFNLAHQDNSERSKYLRSLNTNAVSAHMSSSFLPNMYPPPFFAVCMRRASRV